MNDLKEHREWLKASGWLELAEYPVDQRKKLPPPPLQKPYPEAAWQVDLTSPQELALGQMSVREAIAARRSRRKFKPGSLTLEEISFLCWATQGVREVAPSGMAILRTVPSGGSRHPFETYLAVAAVEDLRPGLYRYLSLEHKLCLLEEHGDIRERIGRACMNQRSAKLAAATFVWTAIPYRTEWRYGMVSAKLIAQDSGHVMQNLYLAVEALGLGTVAVGAYHQQEVDTLLGVDGIDEFAIYAAPVGRV